MQKVLPTGPDRRRWAAGIGLLLLLAAAAVLFGGMQQELTVRHQVIWEHELQGNEGLCRWSVAAAAGDETVLYVTDAHRKVVYLLRRSENGNASVMKQEAVHLSGSGAPAFPAAADDLLLVYDLRTEMVLAYDAEVLSGSRMASPQGELCLRDMVFSAVRRLVAKTESELLGDGGERLAEVDLGVRQMESSGDGEVWLLADLIGDQAVYRVVLSWPAREMFSVRCEELIRWWYLAEMGQDMPFWRLVDLSLSETKTGAEPGFAEEVYRRAGDGQQLVDVSFHWPGWAVLQPGEGPLNWEVFRQWGRSGDIIMLRGVEGSVPNVISPSSHGVWMAQQLTDGADTENAAGASRWEIFLLDAAGELHRCLEIDWPDDKREGPVAAPAGDDVLYLLHPSSDGDRMVLREVWAESRWRWKAGR